MQLLQLTQLSGAAIAADEWPLRLLNAATPLLSASSGVLQAQALTALPALVSVQAQPKLRVISAPLRVISPPPSQPFPPLPLPPAPPSPPPPQLTSHAVEPDETEEEAEVHALADSAVMLTAEQQGESEASEGRVLDADVPAAALAFELVTVRVLRVLRSGTALVELQSDGRNGQEGKLQVRDWAFSAKKARGKKL